MPQFLMYTITNASYPIPELTKVTLLLTHLSDQSFALISGTDKDKFDLKNAVTKKRSDRND